MKKTVFTLGLAILLIGLSSCHRDVICIRGQGSTYTEQRDLEDFSEVEVNIPATVYITQDESIVRPEMSIEAQENILDNMETYVRGNRLVIKFDRCVMSHRDVAIYLTVKDLNEIQLNGSGDIKTENQLITHDLIADLNGSGDMLLNVDAKHMKVKVDGSGDYDLEGTTDELEININGSGDIRAFDLLAKSVWVDVNGSGNAEVQATEYLQVHINGSGNVRYKGNPSTDISINGSGNVRPY